MSLFKEAIGETSSMEIIPGDCLAVMQMKVHDNAKAHGWWDDQRSIPELLVLIHSEVSEALEAYRNNDRQNYQEELADIFIRLLDAAEGYGINLEAAVIKKHCFNISRPRKHGGKCL